MGVPYRSLEVSYFVCFAIRRNLSNLVAHVLRNEHACLCLLAWLLYLLVSDKLACRYPTEILLNAKLICKAGWSHPWYFRAQGGGQESGSGTCAGEGKPPDFRHLALGHL